MSKYKYIVFIIFAALFFSCSSEDFMNESIKYMINEPIVMDAATFRRSVVVNPVGKEIKEKSKMSIYGNYIYINEPEKGIHIYDNTYAEKPINVGFIELIGNTDFIVVGTTLYANAFIDMVWFDLSNPTVPKEKGRTENIFKSALPRINNEYGYLPKKNPADIVVGWRLIEMSQSLKESLSRIDTLGSKSISKEMENYKFNSNLSRFATYGDYIYAAIDNNLHVFINNNRTTESIAPIYLGQEATSINIANNILFVGMPSSLLIYSLNNPTSPNLISTINNIYPCNPIAIQNNLAFLTIHSDNACKQTEDVLMKIYLPYDYVTSKLEPNIDKFNMTRPKGVAFIHEYLFVCDDGLKIFYPYEMGYTSVSPIQHYKNIIGDDIIPIPNSTRFFLVKQDGIYQYDASDIYNINLLSKINTNYQYIRK